MNINRHFVPLKVTLPPAGIDKLILTTKDFEVRDTTQLCIVPNMKKQGDEQAVNNPLFTCGGRVVYGSKAFHNSTNDEGGTIQASINWTGLQIQFNPSKMLGKYSGELATVEEAVEVTATVESYLNNNGIFVPLKDMAISRIDIAKDRLMQQKVFGYKDVFDLLRTKGYGNKVNYAHGVMLGNRQSKGVFYDKDMELNPKSGSSNHMRGEARFLKTNSVAKKIGISSITDLRNADMGYIGAVYSNFINSDIYHLKNAGSQMSFDFVNEVQLLKHFKEQGRNSFRNWIMVRGVEATLVAVGGMDNLKRIIEEVYSRQKIGGYLKEVEALLNMKATIDKDSSTLAHKYEEVRLKFVA